MAQHITDRKEAIQQEIEDEILGGSFRPGERLDERVLAERFGLSRTPIREILNQIAASGLVIKRPNQGMFVAQLTIPDVFEIFELLAEYEAIAARLAAKRMTPGQKALLQHYAGESRKAADAADNDAFARANAAFHQTIYDGAHNKHLAEASARIDKRALPFRRQLLQLPNHLHNTDAEHQEITQAILAGDAARASELMSWHLDLAGRQDYALLLRLLSDILAPAGDAQPEAARTSAARRPRRATGARQKALTLTG